MQSPAACPPRQALLVPLLRQGAAPYGFLVAALNRYRPLDDDYRLRGRAWMHGWIRARPPA